MVLIKFFAPQMQCLFEGGTYLRAALILKNGHAKEKNAESRPLAQVTGKRKGKVGLVVPAKFTSFATELRIARILNRELNGRAVKYNHFELKNIAFDEKKFPVLF